MSAFHPEQRIGRLDGIFSLKKSGQHRRGAVERSRQATLTMAAEAIATVIVRSTALDTREPPFRIRPTPVKFSQSALRPWWPFRGASPSLECEHSHKCGGGRCSDFCYGTCRADEVTTGRAKEDGLAATWMNGTQRAHASPSPRRSRCPQCSPSPLSVTLRSSRPTRHPP
jgi:hypothetical protein